MKKKIFGVLLAATLTVSSLAACGGSTEAPAADAGTETEAPAADEGGSDAAADSALAEKRGF